MTGFGGVLWRVRRFVERDQMTQVLAVTTGLFRDRDLFVHDGSKLRRFRLSAPLQAVFFLIMLGLIAWASYATARLIAGPHMALVVSLPAATEARARMIEQRQALIEAALAGQKIDPQLIAAASANGRLVADGPLARVEQQQLEQAALVAKALDVRYQVTAAELKRLGITPARVGSNEGVGGPFETAAQLYLQEPLRQLEKARSASGRNHCRPLGQAGQDQRRVHQRVWNPIRSVPRRRRLPPRD